MTQNNDDMEFLERLKGLGDMAIENMFQCSCLISLSGFVCKECRREGRRHLHRCPNCLDLHNIYGNCKCPYPENEAYKKKSLERVLKRMKVSRDANANKVIILACAHCGGQASVSVFKVDDAPLQAHIYCEGCGAQTGNDLDFLNPKPDDKSQVILDAINKWNKRTNHLENYGRIYNLETGCHE